jgi:hypothetical protein
MSCRNKVRTYFNQKEEVGLFLWSFGIPRAQHDYNEYNNNMKRK